MDTADLIRVTNLVQRFLHSGVDYENVAMDIILESWQKGHYVPSRSFIKNRCWDALRKHRTELKANEGLSLRTKSCPNGAHDVEFDNLMTKLVRNLSADERRLVWYRFWLSLKVPEISKRMGLGRARTYAMLGEVLYKMRQEIGNDG